jgi:hypothetical protein
LYTNHPLGETDYLRNSRELKKRRRQRLVGESRDDYGKHYRNFEERARPAKGAIMGVRRRVVNRLSVLAVAGMLVASAIPAGARDPEKTTRRVSPPTVKQVENAFQGKTEQPRYNLYLKLRRAQESADRPEVVAALVRRLRHQLDKHEITGADLQLLSLLGSYSCAEAEEALTSFFKSDDVRVIIVTLRAMTDSNRLPPWSDIVALTKRDDYPELFALRRGVVRAAEQDASRDAVDFLIETVGEADGQLKYEAARSLTELTGQTFGGRGDKWRTWWRTARDDFRSIAKNERISGSLKNDLPWDGPVPRFYRLPIYARRVLFMIDRSGSMMLVDDSGESRIDRARRELEAALEALPPDAEFDIVAFHDSVTSFSPRLVRATIESKQAAILFARNLVATKDTNCYDALSLALEADPNLEAIYFLSDGAPTTGAIVEPQKIVDAVTLQNQLRVTSLYTLGIDARGEHEAFLKQLAERNYGEYFSIR